MSVAKRIGRFHFLGDRGPAVLCAVGLRALATCCDVAIRRVCDRRTVHGSSSHSRSSRAYQQLYESCGRLSAFAPWSGLALFAKRAGQWGRACGNGAVRPRIRVQPPPLTTARRAGTRTQARDGWFRPFTGAAAAEALGRVRVQLPPPTRRVARATAHKLGSAAVSQLTFASYISGRSIGVP